MKIQSETGLPKKRNPPTSYEIHIRTAKTNKQNPLIVMKSTA